MSWRLACDGKPDVCRVRQLIWTKSISFVGGLREKSRCCQLFHYLPLVIVYVVRARVPASRKR